MRLSLITMNVLLVGCTSAAMTSVCGCFSESCDELYACKGAPEFICVADPATGPARDGCGVFVSSSLGDDSNPGIPERPVRTLARAIALAQGGTERRVYACAEVFPDPVEVPGGVELRGGLDCTAGWAYVGTTTKTTIAPEPGLIPLQIVTGNGPAVVTDVRAEAATAVEPSGSSIAAMILPDASAEIARSELRAGDGAPGAAGEDAGVQPAMTGAAGLVGSPACAQDVTLGAPAVQTVCDGVLTTGGKGGDGFATYGGNGADGQPEPVQNPLGLGRGGTGEINGQQCAVGIYGANGMDGLHGLGASGPGSVSFAGWIGENGQSGGNGLPGQGGGGGGASRAGSLLCGFGSGPIGGASGGSGGAGGCGGKGGRGGGYGGASIGLLSLSGNVAVRQSVIFTGKGGDGGDGGLAQAGGMGGLAGLGGQSAGMANAGCQGGSGGFGGDGGFGGGGLGGPSIGIAYVLGHQPALERDTIEIGGPGLGGASGHPALPSGAGKDGFADEITGFPLAANQGDNGS